jgi:hypothetical protein
MDCTLKYPYLSPRKLLIALLLLLQAIMLTGSSQSAGNCYKVATSSICSDLVDYYAYVPPTESLASLELKALHELSYPYLQILTPSCQANVKKLVCSSIYLRCISQMTTPANAVNNRSVDPSLYPSTNYAVAFQRPCQSLCNEVFSSVCWNAFTYQIFPFLVSTCSDVYDYSYGNQSSALAPMRYDASNNTAKCFTISKTISIADSMEVYPTSGVCYGVFDPPRNIYIPSGTVYGLPPMRSSSSIMSLLEASASAQIDALPQHLSSTCYESMVQYICQSSFKRAQSMDLFSVLINNPSNTPTQQSMVNSFLLELKNASAKTYMPMYPASKGCKNAVDSCGVLLTNTLGLAAEDLKPQLCQKQIPSIAMPSMLVQAFADDKKSSGPGASSITVQVASFPASASYAVLASFNTSIDISGHTDSQSSFQTTCPYPYVVPDDPDGDNVRYAEGTGCAVACHR